MKFFLSASAILMLLSKVNTKKIACYPEIKELGYECCEIPCTVERTDEYGYWGKQNGVECGCGMSGYDKHKIESCDEFFTSQGYKCCKDCNVLYKDNDGYYWGSTFHNVTYSGIVWDDWCGISDYCMNVIGVVDWA